MKNRLILLLSMILFGPFLNRPDSNAQDDDLNRAEQLDKQLMQLNQQGKYFEAVPLARDVLGIRERILGPIHQDVAKSLNNLAGLLFSLGDYVNAEPLLKRSLSIWEKTLSPSHPNVATSLNNLAELYRSMCDFAKAEPLFKRSLNVYEKAFNPNHPNVAQSLNNLAALYYFMGDFAMAEPLYKRSLSIREKTLGQDHPDVAQSLNNLAELYRLMGAFDEAESLHKRSLFIKSKALGPDHPDVATSLNKLAALYHDMGNSAEIEPLFKRSLFIMEKTLGQDHPNVAQSLSNQAELYRLMGDFAKAEPLFKRSLSIREKTLGQDHPDVASSLNSLALLYKTMGDYTNAENFFKRSLEVWGKHTPSDHPHLAEILGNLAVLYAAKEEFSKSHELLMRGQEIDEKIIDQVLGFTSEDRQELFLRTRQGRIETALTLAVLHLKEDPSVRKNVLDIWLRRKGIILETQRRFQEALIDSDDSRAMAVFHELGIVRTMLSQMIFVGPGKERADSHKKRLEEIENQKRTLEARLRTFSKVYALKKKIEKADSMMIAKTLPVNTALLEFARINTYNFKAKGNEEKWLPARYLAFVLHARKGDKVELVDLGDAGEIDRTVAIFKNAIGDTTDGKALKAIDTSKKIYKLVFEPLKKVLSEVKEIFISPDGNLNLIPFEVLQGPDGKFLIQDYTFNYLAAGRDIIGFGEIREKSEKALLMGDPDFDMGVDEKEAVLKELGLDQGDSKNTSNWPNDMRGLIFTRLPGTGEEVNGIEDLMGKDNAECYTGGEALEEVLIHKGTPRILHLATHGFFLYDLNFGSILEDRMGGDEAFKPMSRGVKLKNSLLRSGIVLAGANNALRSGNFEKNDGIVTAEKILGLKLMGCDMVVLSACNTGLGEVKSGEGVYGLRRSFVQAGAKSLVMSMWSVPDKETKELMLAFYRNLLSEKMNRRQALREAALNEMAVVTKRYGYPNPFFWGAFVFLGEP